MSCLCHYKLTLAAVVTVIVVNVGLICISRYVDERIFTQVRMF